MSAAMDAIASQSLTCHQIADAMSAIHTDVALSSIVNTEQTVFSVEGYTFMRKERCHLSVERQVFRCSHAQSIVSVEQPQLIGSLQGKVNVVCREKNGLASFA